VNDFTEEQLSKVARVTHEIQAAEEIKYLETKRLMKKHDGAPPSPLPGRMRDQFALGFLPAQPGQKKR
jgi:hypothetical protein